MPKNFSFQRLLEVLTGAFPWMVIVFIVAGSLFIPDVIAYLVIIFNVYWLYRSFQTASLIVVGYLNIRATEKVDWLARLEHVDETKDRYKKTKHIIIIPNVKEPLHALERNIQSLVNQNFPLENVYVVLAMEERGREDDTKKVFYLTKKFKNKFGDLLVTWHQLVPGETIGKHSNNASTAKKVKKILIDERGMNIKEFLVTTCDADTTFPNQYLSLLTYKFLTVKNSYHRFFQAPFFMYNNVRRLPVLMRLRILMAGVGYMATLQKVSGRFMSFSTYSVSLDLLNEVGYWDVDVIPEDWHINLKSYFALKGDIDIIPLNIPVLGDAPESTSAWKTFTGTYQTEKRWAWGVVDVPYVISNFLKHPEIPLWDRLKKVSLTMEWHITWSTSWFLITLGATIPTILNPAFARTTLGYTLPKLSSFILTICIIGLLTMVAFGNVLDPHNPTKKSKILAFLHPLTFLQMLTLPVFGLLLGALPGLESQTRLMLGKYIGYRTSDKI